LHMLWLGPDEFLAVDVSRRQQPGETLIAEASLDGLPGQAVDLSANRTILQLSGSKAREVLEKSCRADLHPRAFGVGTAIVTALGPVPVIIHHSSVLEYRIFPRASCADFTVCRLLDGMAEFLGDVTAGVADGSAAEGTGCWHSGSSICSRSASALRPPTRWGRCERRCDSSTNSAPRGCCPGSNGSGSACSGRSGRPGSAMDPILPSWAA